MLPMAAMKQGHSPSTGFRFDRLCISAPDPHLASGGPIPLRSSLYQRGKRGLQGFLDRQRVAASPGNDRAVPQSRSDM